eukprot:678743-Prorocentrum_minimum.AAC.1
MPAGELKYNTWHTRNMRAPSVSQPALHHLQRVMRRMSAGERTLVPTSKEALGRKVTCHIEVHEERLCTTAGSRSG